MIRKDVLIKAPVAVWGSRAQAANILHHCPFCCNCTLSGESEIDNSDYCNGTMEWDDFKKHLKQCFEENGRDR